MNSANNLRSVDRHFAFGENWASFAGQVDEAAVENSAQSLQRLLPREELAGKRMIDIGCGSGLHALAACRLGVASLLGVDLDPVSVETTRRMLGERAPAGVEWDAKAVSVFDLDPAVHGKFDIVYSWGVLHHTGDMYAAIDRAAALVEPGGLFAFALYRRTSALMDRLWTREKRWYTSASPRMQSFARSLFVSAMRLGYRLRGGSFAARAASYSRDRGAEIMHDIHDWMGGYPYEVISPEEVAAHMRRLGFEEVRSLVRAPGFGLFGSGCDEYVYRRIPAARHS